MDMCRKKALPAELHCTVSGASSVIPFDQWRAFSMRTVFSSHQLVFDEV